MRTLAGRIGSLAVAALFAAGVAEVQGTNWTGGAGPYNDYHDWHDAGNWDNGVPDSGTNVFFDSSDRIHIFQQAAEQNNFDGTGSGTDLEFLVEEDWSMRHVSSGGVLEHDSMVINHVSGDVDVEFDLFLAGDGQGTYNLHDGGHLHVDRTLRMTDGSGESTFNMYGGELSNNSGILLANSGSGNATFNLHGGSASTGHRFFPTSGGSTADAVGTFRAHVGPDYSALQVSGDIRILGDGTANLEVQLPGNVMLDENRTIGMDIYDGYTLITAGGMVGEWTNKPEGGDELWVTQHMNNDWIVNVNPAVDLTGDPLNASVIGDSIDAQGNMAGIIDVENPAGAVQNLLLGLDFTEGSDSSQVDAFSNDLAAAGYNLFSYGDGIGLDLDIAGIEDSYFAWDLTEYNNNPTTLRLDAITIIPEPSSLALLALAGLLLMKRRRV